MAIRSVKTGLFSRSMLVGNSYYIPPAFESIATASGTGSSTEITFSSIPSTYQHLQIRYIARSVRNGLSDNLIIQFNNDTGTNYATHSLRVDGTTTPPSVIAAGDANGTEIFGWNAILASGSSNTLTYGVGVIDIHDYTSTTKNKTLRAFHGWDNNGSSRFALTSGFRNSTSAITSITLTTSGSNAFATSSTFALYGIKGA